MIFYYMDASAWVKRYLQETGTTWVENLFAQNQLLASASLGLVEVMATLARKHKAGDINSGEFSEKARELEYDWQSFLQIHLRPSIMEMAKELANNLALRGADSVHLAAALYLQRGLDRAVEQLTFVTSDRELKDAARSLGLDVIDPEEQQLPTSP